MVPRISVVALALAAGACTSFAYDKPDGTHVSGTAFFSDLAEIRVQRYTDDSATDIEIGSLGVHELSPEAKAALFDMLMSGATMGVAP